jgi:hypothetical protein
VKFEHEKLDVQYIERKIREEDKRVGRLVTKVLLSPSEWAEFMCTMDMRYMPPDIGQRDRRYTIAIQPTMLAKYSPDMDFSQCTIRTVDVVLNRI